MVNIAVLLKECPTGMELDSTVCNDLYFDFVDDWGKIHCFIQRKNYRTGVLFYPNGTLTNDPQDKCVIFPKGKITWEGFQRPFKDGDILSTATGGVFILQSHPSDDPYHHCYVGLTGCGEFQKEQGPFSYKQFCTRASETEKQKLFDAIEANGYSWDSKTKVLKKTRIEPGDIVVSSAGNIVLVSNIDENGVVHFLCRIDPSGAFEIKEDTGVGKVDNCTLANDRQKQALIKCLVSRGYKYNPGAKTPKKLIEPVFKDGDVAVSTCGDIHLLRTADSSYCSYRVSWGWEKSPVLDKTITTNIAIDRLATEEEREKLFDLIKVSGYRWNSETKTLEDLCPFNPGDVLVSEMGNIVLFSHINSGQTIYYHCILDSRNGFRIAEKTNCGVGSVNNCKLATEEQRGRLFDRLLKSRYKYNPQTNKLEKLVVPRFKVGDRITPILNRFQYIIKGMTNTHYIMEEVEYGYKYTVPIIEDKNWKLVTNKFDISTLKPFDKVLVRNNSLECWHTQFFENYNNQYGAKYPFICLCNNKYSQCVPFEGNEYLLDTAIDCSEYYKTWK